MVPCMCVRLVLYLSTCISICVASCHRGHLLYNQRIIRSSFHVAVTSGINSCVANCQMHRICRSFSYHTSSRVCYLNYVTSNSSSTIMNTWDGFVSSDISTWEQSLAGPCSGASCDTRDRCTVRRTGVTKCSPVLVNGGNPYILVLQKTTWENASVNCISSYGGHLAIVDSIEKINFLTDLILATGISEIQIRRVELNVTSKNDSNYQGFETSGRRAWSIWILDTSHKFWITRNSPHPGTISTVSGDFNDVKFTIGATDIQEEDTWLWVDGSPVNFTYWAPGQPKAVPNQRCLVWKFGNGWRDRSCTDENFYICERSS